MLIARLIAVGLPPLARLLIAEAIARLAILPALIILLLLRRTGFHFGGQFALRFAQHPGVMFRMLQEILGRNPVVRQLCIAGKEQIFLNDLLRRTAHFAFGARAVEDAVDDIADGARAVRFRTRAGLGGSHLVLVSRVIWLCLNACRFVALHPTGGVSCYFGLNARETGKHPSPRSVRRINMMGRV